MQQKHNCVILCEFRNRNTNEQLFSMNGDLLLFFWELFVFDRTFFAPCVYIGSSVRKVLLVLQVRVGICYQKRCRLTSVVIEDSR